VLFGRGILPEFGDFGTGSRNGEPAHIAVGQQAVAAPSLPMAALLVGQQIEAFAGNYAFAELAEAVIFEGFNDIEAFRLTILMEIMTSISTKLCQPYYQALRFYAYRNRNLLIRNAHINVSTSSIMTCHI
jgi:hypothetical protein